MSLQVSLGPLEDYVRAKVNQGAYGSTDEVLCEAVRLLQEQEKRCKARVEAMIEEGLESCRQGRLIPGDQVFAELYAWLDNPQPNEVLSQEEVEAKIERGLASCHAGQLTDGDVAVGDLRIWREKRSNELALPANGEQDLA